VSPGEAGGDGGIVKMLMLSLRSSVCRILFRHNPERGGITAIALMLLVVLTLLGVAATRTATTDIQIASNEIPYKQSFYISEGGIHREAAEVGRGNYPVVDVNTPAVLATQNSSSLPGPAHEVNGTSYDFSVTYEGFFRPPAGYSVIHFSRYDYSIEATAQNVAIETRYYKIGPKAY
jgi:Tfp pilus assembly protein PilX